MKKTLFLLATLLITPLSAFASVGENFTPSHPNVVVLEFQTEMPFPPFEQITTWTAYYFSSCTKTGNEVLCSSSLAEDLDENGNVISSFNPGTVSYFTDDSSLIAYASNAEYSSDGQTYFSTETENFSLDASMFVAFLDLILGIAPVIVGLIVALAAVNYIFRLVRYYTNNPDPVDVYAQRVLDENREIMRKL